MVRVVGARLDDCHDRLWIDKPRQVVDVAVRVVAVDPAAQPDDVADSQVVGEDLFEGRAVEAGVASLDLAEQAFLGRQQRTPAVDVDRTPLHHDPNSLPPLLDPRRPSAASSSHRSNLRGRRLSRWWLSYLAQPLNFQSTSPTGSLGAVIGWSLTTNVGPESRSQTRSVAALKNRTASRSTPTASS